MELDAARRDKVGGEICAVRARVKRRRTQQPREREGDADRAPGARSHLIAHAQHLERQEHQRHRARLGIGLERREIGGRRVVEIGLARVDEAVEMYAR